MAEKPLKIEGPRRIERAHSAEQGESRGLTPTMKLIGGVGVLAVLAVIAWLVLGGRGEGKNAEAAMELGRVGQFIDQGEYAKAIDGDPTRMIDGKPIRGLKAIVDEYGSTSAGQAAALQLGDAYLATGKTAEAARSFEMAAEAEEDIIRAAAQAGLAAVAESEGKFAKAAEQYDAAAAVFGSEGENADAARPLYLLGAATNFEKANEKEEAIARYREIVMRHSASEQNNVARLALARYDVEL